MSESHSAPPSHRYWDRVRPLGFALPHCSECGRFHFYPRPACPFCGGATAPAPASGRGLVHSYSVVYRAPSAAFAEDVPYAVAIVATEEGPHLMTRIVGIDPLLVRIGMRVQVRTGPQTPEPLFEPEKASEDI